MVILFNQKCATMLRRKKFSLWFITFILFISFTCVQGTYKVAVFEHRAIQGVTANETMLQNLEIYRNKIEAARDMGVDLIVFPEYGLTTIDADPAEYAICITNDNHIIKKFHDLAVEHGMYIVVNLLEKESEDSDTKYYNTNLVFDRTGKIIAKYRKINLFVQEKEKNLTAGNETVSFLTEFGVRFGIFTSFDIFCQKPAKDILVNRKVTDVIYPTAWKSYMPFQTSLSIQNGYYVANNVSLLAASYKHLNEKYEGSNIFAADDNFIDVFADSSPDGSGLIVKDLQLNIYRRRRFKRHHFSKDKKDNFITDRKFAANKYKFKQIDFVHTKYIDRICDGDFCCTFNVTLNATSTTEHYKLIIYDGVDELGDMKSYVRFCSLMACADNTEESCGIVADRKLIFNEISVTASFQKDDTLYTPITLTNSLQPIKDFIYLEHNDGPNCTHTSKTLTSQNNVLVFGIFGRVNKEIIQSGNLESTSSSSLNFKQSSFTLFLLLILFYKL